MTARKSAGSTVGATDDEAADHMADALTYLSRVALDVGYCDVAADLIAVRDKVILIALAEKANPKKASA